jgi:hypothetical protein
VEWPANQGRKSNMDLQEQGNIQIDSGLSAQRCLRSQSTQVNAAEDMMVVESPRFFQVKNGDSELFSQGELLPFVFLFKEIC